MADQKISQLPDGAPAQSGDQVPVARGGTNVRVTAADIAALATPQSPLTVPGTSSAAAALRLSEQTTNGTNYVGLAAPASVAADLTFTLPNSYGSNGQVLATNGSGGLSWTTASGGGGSGSPGGSDTEIQFNSGGTFAGDAGLTYNATTNVLTNTDGQLVLTGGTRTTSAPLIDATQTWNASGTTFTGVRVNVTDTASASGSALFDFQLGGTSRLSLTKAGELRFGTAGWLGQVSSSVVGWYSGAGTLAAAVGTVGGATSVYLPNGVLGLSNNGDATIFRDNASDTIALRRDANPQTFRVYNSWSGGGTNFERGVVRWNSNVLEIGVEAGGTGTARSLRLKANSYSLTLPTADGTAGQTLATDGAGQLAFVTRVRSEVGTTGGSAITNVISLTQAQYDAISVKDTATLYVIV